MMMDARHIISYEPFEKLFEQLEASGLGVKNEWSRPIQKINADPELYAVEINHGGPESQSLYITESRARVLAEFLKHPQLGDIDIPMLSGIDEQAKPILQEAIRRYRGLGAFTQAVSLGYRDGRESLSRWLCEALVSSDNPNLVFVSDNDPNLAAKAVENQQRVHEILKAIKKRTPIGQALCRDAKERMPLIIYTLNMRHQNTTDVDKYDDYAALLRLQKAAADYGITLDIPQDFRELHDRLKGPGTWAARAAANAGKEPNDLSP